MLRTLCRAVVLCCALALILPGLSWADTTLLGIATLPGDSSDLSGLTGKQSDGTPQDRLGGLGSGIAYTGNGDEYILVSDRGPKDGASDYICRIHAMTIRVAPGEKPTVALKLTGTTLLSDATGKKFTGALDAFNSTTPEKNTRLDPEAVRVSRTGSVYISDEYGPVIYEFDRTGKRLRSLPVPAHFQIANPGKSPADELPPKNAIGRQPNRGMEGLAISPDGSKLYGILQSPLLQDGALGKDNARVGRNCRILEVPVSGGKTREFVYQLDEPANGVSEILAVNDQQFLVLERDSKGGMDAAFKKVFLIDLTGASDVSAVASLPTTELPKSIIPVKKKLFLDLLDKRFGLAGKDCPEKFEGLAFGPDLPDGRRLLLVTADNDFIVEQPFRVYAFAIDKSDLPGFSPQVFGRR